MAFHGLNSVALLRFQEKYKASRWGFDRKIFQTLFPLCVPFAGNLDGVICNFSFFSSALLKRARPLRFHLHILVNIIFFSFFMKNAEFWSSRPYIWRSLSPSHPHCYSIKLQRKTTVTSASYLFVSWLPQYMFELCDLPFLGEEEFSFCTKVLLCFYIWRTSNVRPILIIGAQFIIGSCFLMQALALIWVILNISQKGTPCHTIQAVIISLPA